MINTHEPASALCSLWWLREKRVLPGNRLLPWGLTFADLCSCNTKREINSACIDDRRFIIVSIRSPYREGSPAIGELYDVCYGTLTAAAAIGYRSTTIMPEASIQHIECSLSYTMVCARRDGSQGSYSRWAAVDPEGSDALLKQPMIVFLAISTHLPSSDVRQILLLYSTAGFRVLISGVLPAASFDRRCHREVPCGPQSRQNQSRSGKQDLHGINCYVAAASSNTAFLVAAGHGTATARKRGAVQ